ncbi:MAG: hypothetical protein Q4D73_01915 [Actinomycetaceae bacterium]|nr:hypothetical protein [Actinomycetaceae bacterium]
MTPGDYSLADLGDFFVFLWSEHTGRTADWLSTLVYFFGFSTGRWITSALTALSIVLIAMSIYRVSRVFFATRINATAVALVATLVSVFAVAAPAVFQTAYVSNLLVYSAAICNYLVIVALLCWVWALGLTAVAPSGWLFGAGLAFLIGTSHEQAAIAVVTLTVGLAWVRRKDFSKVLLATLPVAALVGAACMFLSPGLHQKLARTNLDQNLSQGLLGKAKASLKALFVQFENYPYLLLALGILGLVIVAVVFFFAQTPPAAPTAHPVAAILLLAVVATATMSIPLGSGTGQIRVFNYPILLAGLAAAVSICFAILLIRTNSIRWLLLSGSVLLFTFYGGGGLTHTFWSQYENYPAGREQLVKQIKACPQSSCILTDPSNLPVRHAFSGYGDNEYATTADLRLWLGLE